MSDWHERPAARFDLHLHTDRSDGRYPVAEVLERCARGKLDVVALTDHDLPTPVPHGPQRIADRDLHVIAAAEVSGVHAGREHHLLVYFPGAVPEEFRAFCAAQCRERATRYTQAIDALGLSGLPAADDAAERGERSLTRHHLARGLVAAKHAGSVREAFARYLGDGHPFVPPLSLPFTEAVRVARGFGGVAVWAHPPVNQLEPMLPGLVAAGLQGLEAQRPLLASSDRKKIKSAAKRFGLVLTGGSDWHGWGDDGELGLFHVRGNEIGPFLALLTGPPHGARPADLAGNGVGR